MTALNGFGLSLFSSDSLLLSDTMDITLVPRSKIGVSLPTLVQTSVTTLAGPGLWKPLAFDYRFPAFNGRERVLRQWYNAAGLISTAVQNVRRHLQPSRMQTTQVSQSRSTISVAG